MRTKSMVEVVYIDKTLIILKATVVMGKSDYTSFFRVRKFPKTWVLNKFQTSVPEELKKSKTYFKIGEVIKLKKFTVAFEKFDGYSHKHRQKIRIIYEILAFLAYLNNKSKEFEKRMIRTIYFNEDYDYFRFFRDKYDSLNNYDSSHSNLEKWVPYV